MQVLIIIIIIFLKNEILVRKKWNQLSPTNLRGKIHYATVLIQVVTKGRREIGKIIFIETYINEAGAAFLLCVTVQ